MLNRRKKTVDPAGDRDAPRRSFLPDPTAAVSVAGMPVGTRLSYKAERGQTVDAEKLEPLP